MGCGLQVTPGSLYMCSLYPEFDGHDFVEQACPPSPGVWKPDKKKGIRKECRRIRGRGGQNLNADTKINVRKRRGERKRKRHPKVFAGIRMGSVDAEFSWAVFTQ